jgi:hypothetical protein
VHHLSSNDGHFLEENQKGLQTVPLAYYSTITCWLASQTQTTTAPANKNIDRHSIAQPRTTNPQTRTKKE